MNHKASPRFWQCFNSLPEDVQGRARRAFETLKESPDHPALGLKRIGKFWSARVGLHYRALAFEDGDHVVWFWIGTHSEYDQLIRQGKKK